MAVRPALLALLFAATSVSAYAPEGDAKAAYDRAMQFKKALDYRSARVELMNATAEGQKPKPRICWGRSSGCRASWRRPAIR
jgi:hypothetical protein